MQQKLMRTSIICLVAFVGSMAWAGSDIPSLVGKWKGQAEVGVLFKGDKKTPTTHHDKDFGMSKGELVIEKQKGRVFAGYFKSNKAVEKIRGVINHDNKRFHYVDPDGFVDGTIITPDRIELIYRQITPTNSLAAVGIFTRQK